MPHDEHQGVAFDAVRQFVIAPDRRYRVESRDASLVFSKTGSQFDVQWLVRGARSRLGDRIADVLGRWSGRRLVFAGIGVAGGAALLLALTAVWVGDTTVLRRSHFEGILVLVLAFVVGLVMLIAGIASRRGNASNPRHGFSLELADIVDAKLLPPQSEIARRGEPQVARLHLQARTGGTIKLGLPTDADLETVKSVIPRIAA